MPRISKRQYTSISYVQTVYRKHIPVHVEQVPLGSAENVPFGNFQEHQPQQTSRRTHTPYAASTLGVDDNRVHIHTCKYVHINICVYLHIYVYIYMYVQEGETTHTHARTLCSIKRGFLVMIGYTNIHIYLCIFVHINIQINICIFF